MGEVETELTAVAMLDPGCVSFEGGRLPLSNERSLLEAFGCWEGRRR
jgi:hypothetical protein